MRGRIQNPKTLLNLQSRPSNLDQSLRNMILTLDLMPRPIHQSLALGLPVWLSNGKKAHLLEDKQISSVRIFDEMLFYTLFQAFGKHLEEIHVTWAHFGKKWDKDATLQDFYEAEFTVRRDGVAIPFDALIGLRIIEFSSLNHKMPMNAKIYDGTDDPDDHISRFNGMGNQREWPMPACAACSSRLWMGRLEHGSTRSLLKVLTTGENSKEDS
ncbi:hypothetical protein Tco_1101699 [Tanacetum coccineum]